MTHDTQAPPVRDEARAAARDDKWRLMDWLRRESVRKRQRACQLYPTGDYVSVRSSTEFGTGFSGVQSCGSTTCPHCGSKIGSARRDEIKRAISSAHRQGLTVLFGTLTLRHSLAQSMDVVADAISHCWSKTTSGGGWKADREHFGIVGWVRVFETRFSEANGWHVHVHFLMFVRQRPTSTRKLLGRLFGRWATAAVKRGLRSPLVIAQDLHVVEHDDDGETLGKYLSKMWRNSDPMAWELSGGDAKESRFSVSPGQLLRLAAEGDEGAGLLWAQYELSMHGRRTIAWSRGLRDLFELGEELTDEEIADAEAGTVDDSVLSMTSKAWVRLARRVGSRSKLLRLVESSGAPSAIAWLADLGVTSWQGPPPAD